MDRAGLSLQRTSEALLIITVGRLTRSSHAAVCKQPAYKRAQAPFRLAADHLISRPLFPVAQREALAAWV